MGKDLWEAIKLCIASRFGLRRSQKGHDNLVLTMVRGDTELRLSLEGIGRGDEERIEAFIQDGLPKLVRLHHELCQDNGNSKAPEMIVPPSVDKVWLGYDDGNIVLNGPACLACKHIEAVYLDSPCKTCIHYDGKPGKHTGRRDGLVGAARPIEMVS